LHTQSLHDHNPRQRYTITIEPGHGEVETLCLFFRDGYVEQAWQPLEHSLVGAASADAGFFERLHPKPPSISALLGRVREGLAGNAGQGWLEDRLFEAAQALAALYGTVEIERRRVPALRASTRDEIYRRLHRGRLAIDSRLDGPVRLHEAARAACLSEFHFQRLFKEVFRETPHEYGVRRRLERAARLLRETRLPVTEICFEAGFQSPASFSTLFRRQFRISPREIRKNG
jgi:AraC-like DNA-binding protein